MQGRYKESERLAQTALSIGQRPSGSGRRRVRRALVLTRLADGTLAQLKEQPAKPPRATVRRGRRRTCGC